MIRVLVVGLGSIGQRHLRNLKLLLGADVEFIAYRVRGLNQVVTPTLTVDSTKSIEEEYSVRSFTSLNDALALKPNIALICNPTSSHIPVAMACAAAGCDLFIEKPVSSAMDGLEELSQIAASQSLIVMVGYQMRYHPCFLKLSEVIDAGRLGRLLGVRAVIGEFLPDFHLYEDYRNMYASRADLGGGVVLSQIHEMDFLYALFGMPTRLYAIGGHWSELEIDVEDCASILMHHIYRGNPLPVHLHQDYLQKPPSRQCEVIGEFGKVEADFRKLTVSLTLLDKDGPEVFDYGTFDRNDMFVSEMCHFLTCVKERTKPDVDLSDGIKSLRMALAVKESIEYGTLVEIDE